MLGCCCVGKIALGGAGLFFDSSALAFLAPLTASSQLFELELLTAITAFAFDFGHPFVFAASEGGDVSGDQISAGELNEAMSD